MADNRRRSSSGGRLSGCMSWSREDRANLKLAVGPELEDDRLREKYDCLAGLGDLVGDDDLEGDLVGGLVGDLEGDFGDGDVREAEKEDRDGRRSGLFFSVLSLSLSFLKMWASWTIGGGEGVFFFFYRRR